MPHQKYLALLRGKAVEGRLKGGRALGVFQEPLRAGLFGSQPVRQRDLLLPRRVQRLLAAASAGAPAASRQRAQPKQALVWLGSVRATRP